MLIEDGMSWKTRFTNTILLNNKLWPNDYEVNIVFLPQTDNPAVQNLTYDKYKYLFNKVFQNAIFIKHDKKTYQQLNHYRNDVIDFVSDPYDQLVGVQIFSKLNSIGGEFLKVEALEIESWQGENIRYTIGTESPEWEILQDLERDIDNPWWKTELPSFCSFFKDDLTWDEIGFTINDDRKLQVIKGGLQ